MSLGTVGAIAAATSVVAVCLVPLARVAPGVHVRVAHPDANDLADAGWPHGLRRWEALRLAAALAATVGAAALGIPLALGLAVAVAPSIWIRLRAETARDAARRAVGRVVVTAEAALRSGTSLPDALRRAADASADAIAARPFRDALRSFDLGASLDVALEAAALRAREPRARLALGTLALGIGERLPRERSADLLAAVADRLAFEERLEDEVRARAAGARQQQRLMAALVPALALYLALTLPTLATTLATDLGRFVLIPVALGLELLGIVLGRRITSGALA